MSAPGSVVLHLFAAIFCVLLFGARDARPEKLDVPARRHRRHKRERRWGRTAIRLACSCQGFPPLRSPGCAARRRGGDAAILLILSRRRNATKVSTLRGTF